MERRIEVRLDALDRLLPWEDLGCESCGGGHGYVDADPSLADVLRAAEMAGLDPHREFRMLPHLALGYVEFWQVPTPLPERVPVPAAAGVAS